MKQVLLKEYNQIVLTEDVIKEYREDPTKPVIVVGIIQRADAPNQNRRVYPYNILKKEVDRYKDEVIAHGSGMGQLDHIDSPVIELKDVSHVIDDIWWDGPEKKEVWGKIRLLNTPRGQIAKEIVLSKIPLGISSRALGSLSKNESSGFDVVQDDLNLVCFDLCGVPSTKNAYLSLHENFDPMTNYPRPVRIHHILKDILKK